MLTIINHMRHSWNRSNSGIRKWTLTCASNCFCMWSARFEDWCGHQFLLILERRRYNSGFGWRRTLLAYKKCNSGKKHHFPNMSMDQYLLIPFLGGWTSIYQLFWCSPGVQGFDTLPHQGTSTTKRPLLAPMLISGLKRMEPLAPPRSPIAVWEATLGWAQYMGGSCRVPQ